MAGILDNKKRVMDTIVTQEGKRQLASGQFQIKYASFTDGSTFYESDVASGSSDATRRISFEATNRYQDSIVFETDDSGNMLSFQGNGIGMTPEGSIMMSGDGTAAPTVITTSEAFSSAVSSLTDASLDSFYDLNIIASDDSSLVKKYHDADGFYIKNIRKDHFTITDATSFTGGKVTGTLEESSAFILDEKLAHIDNFQFLPPINYNDKTPNGKYINYNDTPTGSRMQDRKLYRELIKSERINLRLKNVSRSNNSLIQVFETSENDAKITKLDAIDYGNIKVRGKSYYVVFVGKVFVDKYNQPTFINMFTLLMENN
jgi:hypothetical protein